MSTHSVFDIDKIFEKNAVKFIIGWVIVLSLLYSTLSILRHNHFQSGGFDLGLFDQTVWQYSRFIWPYNTVKDRFILGDHLTLTLPLLAPLYYLWNDVRTLLVFQAFWITCSSLAIFFIARNRKFNPFVSFCTAFVYSLFYGIQFAVFFDFKSVVLGVGLLPWLAYFLETKRKKSLLIAILLVLLTQENMGLALASLGCIYIFKKAYRKAAVAFILGGIIASIIASKIITLLSPVGFQYWPQLSLQPIKIIAQFFDSPEKRQVWFYSFAWFSFLPLLSPGTILAVVLDLAQYFVTGPEFARMWSPFMHHRAILAPYLALGMLNILEFLRLRRINITLVAVFILMSAVVQQYIFHFPLNKLTKIDYWKSEEWIANMNKLILKIPGTVSLAAQQSLVPHVSHRKEIYLIWPRQHDFDDNRCGERSCWWLDFGDKPQYLLVDTRPNQWLTQILETNEHWQSAIANMEKAGKITLERSVGDARLYRIIYE